MTDFCLDPHDYGPATYAAWQEWAAQMATTHEQHRCPDCRLWVIWRPRTTEPEPEQLGLLEEGPRSP